MMRNGGLPLCTKPWTTFEVRSVRGDVKCCCWSKVWLGNVSSDSVFDIWNSEQYQYIRKKMLEGDLDKICRYDCDVLHAPIFYLEKQQFYPLSTPDQAEFIENRILNLEEMMAGRTVLSSMPQRIKLHPSDRCNLDCVMCSLDKETEGDPNASVYREVRSLYPFLEELKVFGGEPLCCTVSRDIIFNFDPDRFPNCRIALITNGTLLTQKNIERLLQLNLGWIEISLDAANGETYEGVRRGASWERVIANIHRLLSARQSAGMHFPVILSMTVQKRNYSEIPRFVELGHRLGVDLQFNFVMGTDELISSEDSVEKSIREGLQRAYVLGLPSAVVALSKLLRISSRYFEDLQPSRTVHCPENVLRVIRLPGGLLRALIRQRRLS